MAMEHVLWLVELLPKIAAEGFADFQVSGVMAAYIPSSDKHPFRPTGLRRRSQ